jgi:hypothetical protein
VVDADGNGIVTPGDTLEYTITYANNGGAAVTGVDLMDDYNETLLETPSDLSPGGTIADGTITWDLGAIAGHGSGSVTYRVQIKPAGQFPKTTTQVWNVAMLDTDQTAPIAATAEIQVIGDSIAPVTTATVTLDPNAAGWNNTDATLILTAVDNPGGSGVADIHYSLDGGCSWVVVSGDRAVVPCTQEGTYSVAYYAVDAVGNAETPQTIQVKLDKTVPLSAGQEVAGQREPCSTLTAGKRVSQDRQSQLLALNRPSSPSAAASTA